MEIAVAFFCCLAFVLYLLWLNAAQEAKYHRLQAEFWRRQADEQCEWKMQALAQLWRVRAARRIKESVN